MSIDIDNFLEKFSKEESIPEEKKVEKVDLDFQKDVEDKIDNANLKSKNADFQFLQKIYEEVKKFDEDLPIKFFGIERKGGVALKEVGATYSKEFVKRSKENISNIEKSIRNILQNIKKMLSNSQYGTVLKELQTARTYYRQFPSGFMDQKTNIGKEIREVEIEIYEVINKYKVDKVQQIKTDIKQKAASLRKSITTKETSEIEKEAIELDMYMNQIPKILLTHLTQEHKIVAQTMIAIEEELQVRFREEFERDKEKINTFIQLFESHKIKKDVENCLLIYDELLIEFQRIPDIFVEEKIEVYEKITDLYTSINNLILESNITFFLETYKNSKLIDEIRKYIQNNIGNKTNQENLHLLKEKILSIPDKFKEQRDELLIEFKKLEDTKVVEKANIKPSNRDKDVKDAINEKYNLLKNTSDVETSTILVKEIKNLIKELNMDSIGKQNLLNKVREIYEGKK